MGIFDIFKRGNKGKEKSSIVFSDLRDQSKETENDSQRSREEGAA